VQVYFIAGVIVTTTFIAITSVWFASGLHFQQRVLPWTAGVLLGLGVFWILPEIASERGWWIALGGVLPIALVLACIDRYTYPICPFCSNNFRTHGPATCRPFSRRAVRIGWPLLIVGCVHCFLDGWAIALVSGADRASIALSYGVIVHKLPESVAIGIVAARLTSNRTRALMVVTLIQLSLLAGCLFSRFSPYHEITSLEVFSVPACACLLLFGFLALEDEWRLNGPIAAVRAAFPGMIGCGLAALATRMLVR
jgi:zinc transporter ZupT